MQQKGKDLIRQSDYENYDYRQFWQDNKRLYEDSSERLVIKKFISAIANKDAVFIDLGCGFGRLFSEYRDFSTIILLDYSINNLKNAKELISRYVNDEAGLMEKVIFVAADVTRLPLKPDVIDYAMTVRVIHHMDDPGRYFEEVSRVVKTGGIFMLEFANKRNTKNILRFFAGRIKQSPFNAEPLQIGATILDYHPNYIKHKLNQAGFKVKKMVSASNFRLGFLKRHVSLKILLFFESIYQNIFSFIDTGPSIFLKTILVREKCSSGSNENDSNTKKLGSTSPISLFMCPACQSTELFSAGPDKNSPEHIVEHEHIVKQIVCSSCQRQYPLIDGIFDFKV